MKKNGRALKFGGAVGALAVAIVSMWMPLGCGSGPGSVNSSCGVDADCNGHDDHCHPTGCVKGVCTELAIPEDCTTGSGGGSSSSTTGSSSSSTGSSSSSGSTGSSTGSSSTGSSSSSTSSSSTSSGSAACNMNGTCDVATEDCSCADCASQPVCGAGCTTFTITKITFGAGFGDGEISQIDGPEADTIQFNGFGGLAVGTHELVEPKGFSDCNAGPCIAAVADNYAQFYQAVKGKIVITSVSPLVGEIVMAAFYPRKAGPNNDFIIDKSGKCQAAVNAPFPPNP